MTTDQLLLSGMPAQLFTCTPSKLASFEACPRRYRFTYVDRPGPPRSGAWAHTSVGASLHNALRALWELPVERRSPPAAAALLRQGWPVDGFRDDAQRAASLRLASGWIERYVEGLDVTDTPRGIERVVSLRTGALALSGRIDRLDERSGELVIVDYKAGRHLLSVGDARGSSALALYALAAKATFRLPCTTVELHHLPSGEVHAFDHTTASLALALDRAEATAAQAVAATEALQGGSHRDRAFPARPSAACTWCDFQRHCPDGLAVGQHREPWAGLPESVRG